MFQEEANKRREKRRPWLGRRFFAGRYPPGLRKPFSQQLPLRRRAHDRKQCGHSRAAEHSALLPRCDDLQRAPEQSIVSPAGLDAARDRLLVRPRPATVLVSFVDLCALRRAHAAARVCHRITCSRIAAPSSSNRWIALAAAAWYGLHPANADTINYIIASSEVISTLGVIASFAVYFAFPHLRRYYLYVLPAAIAILAKPTAAIFPVLFAIYSSAVPERERDAPHRARGYSVSGELSHRF